MNEHIKLSERILNFLFMMFFIGLCLLFWATVILILHRVAKADEPRLMRVSLCQSMQYSLIVGKKNCGPRKARQALSEIIHQYYNKREAKRVLKTYHCY